MDVSVLQISMQEEVLRSLMRGGPTTDEAGASDNDGRLRIGRSFTPVLTVRERPRLS